MKGFDQTYSDLPDYILKCTAHIWEGRDIAAINWHYGDDLLVRTPAGISRGNGAGKANTMATLTEFPDRQLFGEDVIWSGDKDAGFLSSHRIISTAPHAGGAFGPTPDAAMTARGAPNTPRFCTASWILISPPSKTPTTARAMRRCRLAKTCTVGMR